MSGTISLDRFQDARRVLQGKVVNTPLVPFNIPQLEHQIYLKAENLQTCGSFKIRGATYCISHVPQDIDHIVAYSTGNHAQAVALAAKKMNKRCTIVMSPDALDFKVAATKLAGAEVIMVPIEERQSYAEQLAEEPHAYLVPPYDHLDIITGQGTIGLEILDVLEPAIVFVPVGGGGLIAGIAMALKLQNPRIKIVGVEPELEDDATRSFKSKTLFKQTTVSNTIADAVKIPLGTITFPIMCAYVDEMVTVSEEQIRQATILIAETEHLIAEPSGALGVAALLAYPGRWPADRPIVCVISGGNITISYLSKLVGGTSSEKI